MEHTAGLGKQAEVWLGGHFLTVCDNISAPGRRCPPGVVENVRFTYVTEEAFNWADAATGNPSRKKVLAHIRDWTYIGYGQVAGVMPVVIDFGVLKMEDANWTSDDHLLGRYVRVQIDRLEIREAVTPDWPEGAK